MQRRPARRTGEPTIDLPDGTRYLFIRMPKTEKFRLSPREQEIVRIVAEGHPNKIIADVLNISSWTVCTHLRRIFAKLGVGSRAAMVARLFDGGRSRHRQNHFDSTRPPRSRNAARIAFIGASSSHFSQAASVKCNVLTVASLCSTLSNN